MIRLKVAPAAAALALLAPLTVSSPPTTTVAATVPRPDGAFVMAQANLKVDLTVDEFRSDIAKIKSTTPDVITYNEVHNRADFALASDGYYVWRDESNRYKAETAVAWRADKWTKVASGVFRISNYRHRPPRKYTRLGIRWANWVRLQNADGRVINVIAAHPAPLFKDGGKWIDLIRPSVTRLSELVGQLAPTGPVLVGGDFNVHYRSGRYPRDLLTAAGLVPTYDTLGNYFPTGDHFGATIDYIFNRGEGRIGAVSHEPVELRSDHAAVIAGFDWLVDAPDETTTMSNDLGTQAGSMRTLYAATRQVRLAQPGSTVELVTADYAAPRLTKRIKEALGRGVHIQLTTRSVQLTRAERRVTRAVAASGDAGSYVRRCVDACRDAWLSSGMAQSMVLVHGESGKPTVRVDLNRNLNDQLWTTSSTAKVFTGKYGLREGEQQLAAISSS